jgi:hypothetical protein
MYKNSPMTTNIQLQKYADKLNIPLNGIYYKDRLKYINPLDGAYIINLGDSNQGGTHWVSLYLDNNNGLYFDSFGVPPPLAIEEFYKRYSKKPLIIANKQIQNINGGYCGQYNIHLLYSLSNGRGSLKEKLKRFYKNYYSY